ncbi:MAG: efflux RND transporter permease subunit, partial [Rhodobacteraceae bacterium]|nr:efflux RND transporter permease subunit [Paracoccaceae bacterium]
ESMVSQLEGSVLTAIALVMIVVLAALGARSSLLVGFAIPTSFLLCFAFLAVMGVTISNIVMFGLILAVGMLVDGAIVVVEYADRRIKEGSGPMAAYVAAAKRMFWPIVSSTATTLCAFLPMLFWPGVPGQFMGMLPVTLIFVLSASLVVALIYLPVMGGASGRMVIWIQDQVARFRSLSFVMHILSVIGIAVATAALAGIASFTFASASGFFAGVDTSAFNFGLIANLFYFVGICLILVVSTALAVAGAFFAVLGAFAFFPRLFGALGATISRILPKRRETVSAGYKRTTFGRFINFIAANPLMPIVAVSAVAVFVMTTFFYFTQKNNGVEFFVESEPEQAIVYVRARGNLGLNDKDVLVQQVEDVILDMHGIDNAFSFAGEGGLNANTGGASGPSDAIGQVQIELVPWEDRPAYAAENDIPIEELDGDVILAELQTRLDTIPGIYTEILNLAQGPSSGKPVHLRLSAAEWEDLYTATEIARNKFDETEALIDIEDTRPLPGIDWQIDVDVEAAGRYGADVATVGGMIQLVTRGILLDTMRVDSSDEEIEIRVRLPEEDRVLSTLDTLKVRTQDGLVPLSNFVTREPVEKLALVSRVNQKRVFDVKADVATGLTNADGAPINPNERIAALTEWLETDPFPATVEWEWTGDQEEQAESGEFLATAFAGALALMFIILLAQFNSFYNAVLVLVAVVLSTTGVLIGMLVMQQPFSIIMTGTGIVALAGIVVNNNIVLIDTYQEYSKYMPRIEAIVRTAEVRIRPVLLTTITTMAGLAPMMFGLSLDFFGGGYTIDSPTALWWKQLATAVVFGLGIATVLTLVFTPSMLALRVWFWTYVRFIARALSRVIGGSRSQAAQDWALRRAARKVKSPELLWDTDVPSPKVDPVPGAPLRAAE